MYRIVKKQEMTPHINLFAFDAPDIAEKSKPGHFVMVKIDERGERIPLNIADVDAEKGSVTVLCHVVGKTTAQLGKLGEGDAVSDLLGPLGKPLEMKKYGTVLCIGGDVFIPSLHFTARALKEHGNRIIGVVGARTKEEILYEKEMEAVCDELHVATDDGTKGHRGFSFMNKLLKKGAIDLAVAMGPVILMKTVSALTRPHSIPTMVYLIPLMVDGMGMCGACRVTVGDEVRYACVDGPFFDGHLVDYDELMARLKSFTPHEKIAYVCYEKGGMHHG